jgi:hypothetical protein
MVLLILESLLDVPFNRSDDILRLVRTAWPSLWIKGETADLGFWDFLRFWDFLGFFGIFFGILKIQKNRKLWNFRLNYSSYIGFVVLRIS